MAVTKLWSVTERLGQVIDYATNPKKTSANIKREFSPEQYQALADVIAYAKEEEKTEREFYVEGINCNVAIARVLEYTKGNKTEAARLLKIGLTTLYRTIEEYKISDL